MLGKIASFEFRYHLLSPALIAIFTIFLLFGFAIPASPNVSFAGSNAVHVNSPYVISLLITAFSVFGMVIPAVFLASGILRDRSYKTQELFYSSPVRENDYLIGRFIGGFLITAIAFISFPIGFMIGAAMPWVDPETLGPFNILYYAYPYLVFGVGNMLVLGMILFTAANLSRSLMVTWVTLVALFAFNVVGGFLAGQPEWREFAALTDPFAGNAFGEVTRYWTPAEQNTQLVPMEGLLLQNRLIWFGIAIALFVFNLFMFSFRARNSMGLLKGAAKRSAAPFIPQEIELPKTTPNPAKAVWQQFRARVGFEVKGVVFNIAFWILLALGILLVGTSVFLIQPVYGTPSYPLTRIMISSMIGGFILVPIIVVIYYASELMWRERAYRFSDIVDATPAPNWVFLMAKLVGMLVVIGGLIGLAVAITMLSQIVRGYFNIEFGQYAIRTLMDLIIPLTFLSMLAIFLQVLTNNKWLGIIALGGLFIVTAFVLGPLGFTHGLYRFPFVSIQPYSDMNGFGHFMGIQAWWHLYWGAISVFLFTIAFVMWNRGALEPIWRRLMALPRSFSGSSAAIAALSLLVAVGSGGWIFYNTVVLNDFVPGPEGERLAAEFENEWREQLEDLPQPTIIDVEYTVDIFPRERRYAVTGSNVIENRTDGPIPVIWVSYGQADVLSQSLEGGSAELQSEYANLYAIELDTPMQPGERRELSFDVEVTNPGFTNGGNISSVNYNGTFFNNGEFAPSIGFNRGALIQDPQVRRRKDLPPLERAYALEDESRWGENYIRQDSDYVSFRTIVSTVEGQTAIAPGYLQRDWVENGRHYFEYVMEDRSLNFFNWMSADYTILEEEEDGILYQVFYHADHAWNVDRMMAGAQDSLAYMSESYSPYQYGQYRMFEFPAYASFAQSFPNTIAYSESIGFTADLRDEDNIDYVYYVTAHEAAHQWWAHQIMGPNVQGGSMLVETFAQYSALMVMEREYGVDQMRRFLKYELDNYLTSRGGETREELPLYRVENQPYVHYRKGAVIMYALQDYVGEDTVNRALNRLVAEFQYASDPYPTTLDFLRLLREEAGPEWESVITDFFQRIMVFDLKIAEDGAVTRELEDGRWETTISIEARLFEADGAGEETEVAIDYQIDIGLFTRGLDGAIEGSDHVLYMDKHRINENEMSITIITDERPLFAGIDPYNKLIDRNSDDNLLRVVDESDADDASETDAGNNDDTDDTGNGAEAGSD